MFDDFDLFNLINVINKCSRFSDIYLDGWRCYLHLCLTQLISVSCSMHHGRRAKYITGCDGFVTTAYVFIQFVILPYDFSIDD